MKSKYVVLASALLIQQRLAQKTKLKLLKSVKKRKPQEAATILQGAESLLSNADDDEKPSFLCKGNAYLDLANKR
jgi:hypothetical protein